MLLVKCKTPQICFQILVDRFGFSISLGMIGGVGMKLGFLELEQFFPKIVGESGVSVRDNRIRHAMKLEYIIHEYMRHFGSCEWVLKSTKMSIFGETIDYHHDN